MGKTPEAGTTKRPYFGYGSNLDRDGMVGRCPDAEYLGVARLEGWTFWMDSNGYATIEPDGGSVEGTLWLISEKDVALLDDYEGIDRGLYEKREVDVVREGTGEAVRALVYVSLRPPLTMETFRREYLEDIRDAAVELGLNEATQARIAQVRVTEDR
ncbi:gamma-glutamylcyclotransferase family protein [Olsenella profusa]|uniref:Gamma-glutamylcyclotransferase n=1 Tax=Olsenella profusa TaxID=138595 RepID=A0ABS2F223_9ACTN|nr:gamma-glutamylcyclotransferase family protein [Olsenella profusa]MBM6774857.1 gamma-glutamylcyclotransferase [Olsenella profusa]